MKEMEFAKKLYEKGYRVDNAEKAGFDKTICGYLLDMQIKEELEDVSRICVEEGYPSNGSNYEIREEAVMSWYREQYPEYF